MMSRAQPSRNIRVMPTRKTKNPATMVPAGPTRFQVPIMMAVVGPTPMPRLLEMNSTMEAGAIMTTVWAAVATSITSIRYQRKAG